MDDIQAGILTASIQLRCSQREFPVSGKQLREPKNIVKLALLIGITF